MINTKIVLFKSKTLKNGEHPVMIRLIQDRKSKYVSTGISCSDDLWDDQLNSPKKKHPNKFEIDILLQNKLTEIRKTVYNLESENVAYSSEAVVNKVKNKHIKKTFIEYIDDIIENLKKTQKIGNSIVYKDCKRTILNFRKNKDLEFSDIDVNFLKKLENSMLERGVTPNSISVYMRTIRAVFNKAISDSICKREYYPFEKYKISKLNQKTAKRAISKEQIEKIIAIPFDENSKINESKKIFLFSFYCRGINFNDLIKLKWTDIKNNRLEYVRSKTKGVFSISLLPPAVEIIESYREITGYDLGNYIFPILNKDVHKTAAQINNRTKKIIKEVNKNLKVIAEMAGIDFKLTTYVARHSYATVLKKQGVSTSVISELLGHQTEKITQVYLDSFENSVLDEADKYLL